MNANEKAAELRTKLFNLVNEFKAFQQQAWNVTGDAAYEAHGQVDSAACELARVYDNLGDVFTDAGRDAKDQAFAFAV